MRRLFIGRKASHVAPARNTSCCTILCIGSVSRRQSEFRASKQFFVFKPAIAIFPGRYIVRIGERHVRICNAPSVSALCRSQALFCISGIKRFVHTGRHSHHRGKVKRRRRPFAHHITSRFIGSRHYIAREFESRHLMENSPVGILHGKHPIQIVLDFGEKIRKASFGRDVPLERVEIGREMFVQRKERIRRNA